MKRQRAVVCLVGCALLARARFARADEGDLQELLNENVITTASKSADTSSSSPGTSTILTADDIRRYGIHSLDEAIDFLSLGVATAGTLRAADIGARGVLIPGDQGNRFLLLIDGHGVNEPLYGAARFDRGAGVPLELVDHIEVILGPGSILYGSNAMLGVINVVTKRSKDFAGVHAVAESEIGKSWRAAAGAGYQIPLAKDSLNLTLELEYYKLYGPDFKVGPQDYGNDPVTLTPFRFSRQGTPTGIWGGRATESYYAEVPAGQLRLVYDNLELSLHASSYKRAAPSNHWFVSPDSDFNDPGNYELDRSLWADLKHHLSLSSVTQVTSRLYGDFFEYERFMHTSASLDCPYSVTTCQLETYGTSRWAGLEVQGAFDWLKDSRLVTTIGADARARSVAGKSSLRDFDTGVPLASSAGVVQANDRILGTYLQQTYKPSDLLGINGGVRFDAEQHTGLVASPRIAASTAPWHGGTLKAIYSQAFRAPTWHELSYELPNKQMRAENLQPERVQSGEASLEQKLGMQRMIYGVFVSQWTNLIESHELSPAEVADAQAQGKLGNHAANVSQFRNVSNIDTMGLNFGLEGTIGGRLHYGFNLTAAHSDRDLPDGTELPLVVAPKLFGNARAAYVLPTPWPTLAIAGRYQGRRLIEDAYEPRFTSPPSAPPLLELRATVSGPVPGLTGLSYRASADYASAYGGPYAIGPRNGFNRYSIIRPTTAELIPIDQFRTTLGLQYDFN